MAISAEPRFVLFEQTGSIARITLDRPEKLNAINHETGVQLRSGASTVWGAWVVTI